MTATESPPLSDDKREILERMKRWIDTDVADALRRSGQVKVEINVKDTDIRAHVTGFYQVN